MFADTFSAYGEIGVEMLKTAVQPYSATGKTAQSIRFESGELFLRIIGRFAFSAIETGRGPRNSNEYEGFDNSMLEYMNARGIGAGLSDKKRKQLARFLAYRINQKGDDLFRSGGREVYSLKLQKLVEELEQALQKDFAKYFITSLKFQLGGTISP